MNTAVLKGEDADGSAKLPQCRNDVMTASPYDESRLMFKSADDRHKTKHSGSDEDKSETSSIKISSRSNVSNHQHEKPSRLKTLYVHK